MWALLGVKATAALTFTPTDARPQTHAKYCARSRVRSVWG